MPSAGEGAAIQVTQHGGDEPFESLDSTLIHYYNDDAIWKTSTTGGAETKVLDHAVRGHWSLAPSGICYLNKSRNRGMNRR